MKGATQLDVRTFAPRRTAKQMRDECADEHERKHPERHPRWLLFRIPIPRLMDGVDEQVIASHH